MKYTCFKTTVKKVYDGLLDDPEDINNVLMSLKTKEITCSLRIKKEPMHDSVRILKVDEQKINWRLIKDGVSLRKTSLIDDIDTIEVYTDDEVLTKLKPQPSRWSTLDTSSL